MDIAVHGFESVETGRIEGHALPRLRKLEQVLSQSVDTRCEVQGRTDLSPERFCRVQISMHVRGRTLRSEVKGPNVLRAIDAASHKMERQIERFKGRFRKNRRERADGAAPGVFSAEDQATEDLEMYDERGFIVREKEFPVAALGVADAVEAMELLEHDFHLFVNQESGDLNVVYRRRGGNYGLLKPQTVAS